MRIPKVLQVYRWVIIIAVIYLVALFAFGRIYYSLYLNNRQSFAFNSDIQRAQGEVFKTTTEAEINVLEPEIQALNQLSEKLKSSEPIKIVYPPLSQLTVQPYLLISPSPEPTNQTNQITSQSLSPLLWPQAEFKTTDFKIVFRKDQFSAQGAVSFLISVDFYDNQRKVGTQTLSGLWTHFPDQAAQYQDLVTTLSSDLRASLSEDQRRLLTLAGPNPEIWDYWDFFYFSTITQTTVGYGDILPNNTTVRGWVCVQILLGLFLATIGITLAFRALRSEKPATH